MLLDRRSRIRSTIKRQRNNPSQEQQLQNLLHYDIIGNPLDLGPDGADTRLEGQRAPTAALFALLRR